MTCKHDKNQLGKLKPLNKDEEGSYLVPLRFRRPKTIFGFPLFIFRNHFLTYAKIYFSEIKPIIWRKTRFGWSVKLASEHKINGLDSIEPFIKLKDEFYRDLKKPK